MAFEPFDQQRKAENGSLFFSSITGPAIFTDSIELSVVIDATLRCVDATIGIFATTGALLGRLRILFRGNELKRLTGGRDEYFSFFLGNRPRLPEFTAVSVSGDPCSKEQESGAAPGSSRCQG